MPRLESFDISLNLGAITFSGTWKPDEEERKAAWEMYVELVTRISVEELRPFEGSLREALSSLYALFDITRTILREHGPSVAQPKSNGDTSFGCLAILILNYSLRPLLSKWHPLLLDYEQTKGKSVSQIDHEKKWEKNQELRSEINRTCKELKEYANLLADVAKVPRIHSQVLPSKTVGCTLQ